MRRRIVTLFTASLLLLSLVALGSAQGQNITLTGNIVDKACSARAAKDPSAHKKNCALSENCAKSGFGVYADGKFYEFDDKGNELALAKLKASTKEAGAKFKVEGMLHDTKLMVASISEVE